MNQLDQSKICSWRQALENINQRQARETSDKRGKTCNWCQTRENMRLVLSARGKSCVSNAQVTIGWGFAHWLTEWFEHNCTRSEILSSVCNPSRERQRVVSCGAFWFSASFTLEGFSTLPKWNAKMKVDVCFSDFN